MKFKLTQLTEHIWLFPHNPSLTAIQSSLGVIATHNRCVLVDAGNSPRLASKVKAELSRCKLPPVSQIIYTHHHWDHVYGACGFNVPATAHVICQAILEAESQKPWSTDYLNWEIEHNPKLKVSYRALARAIDDWETFRIVVPEEVFEHEKTIALDGLTIELEHVGGGHAADSTIVKVPQDGVMFIGDCYYIPPLHLRPQSSTPSLDMLRRLHHQAYNLYVEGHAKPFTRPDLLKLIQRLTR